MAPRTRRRMIAALLAIVIAPTAVLALLSGMAKRPENLGVRDGQLAACPETPNCVSTRATAPPHAIEPIHFMGSGEQAIERLLGIVENQPRATIVTAEGNYLYAEFTSRIFRFVDDVEFLVDEAEQVIHFRSASRVGRSDLGANRQRMESIRLLFERQPSQAVNKAPRVR